MDCGTEETRKLAMIDVHTIAEPGVKTAAAESGLIGSPEMCVKLGAAHHYPDPLNWGKVAARYMQGSHLDEVKQMVTTFYQVDEVVMHGVDLTVAQVAAVARRPDVRVVLLMLKAELMKAPTGFLPKSRKEVTSTASPLGSALLPVFVLRREWSSNENSSDF